jgi:hypothetical protein
MEGEMIAFAMVLYLAIFIAVLIVVISVIFFIHKRLGHSSWFRKVLAPLAGIGAGLVGVFIVFSIGGSVAFEYSYLLAENSMTQEMIRAKMAQQAIYFNLTWMLTYIAAVPVTWLAGYVAGKIARKNETKYGLTTGICLAAGALLASFPKLFSIFSFANLAFIWNMLLIVIVILAIVIIIGSATLGGRFVLIQSTKNEVAEELV